jgi:hypothetical protein
MFTKSDYWKNRKAGRRGQGAMPSLIVGSDIVPASSTRGLGRRKMANHETIKAQKQKVKSMLLGKYATAELTGKRLAHMNTEMRMRKARLAAARMEAAAVAA